MPGQIPFEPEISESMLTIYYPSILSSKMLNLAVSVTPPKADSDTARMSPVQFTISSPTRASIKRKASPPELTEGNAKHFRLEPPADSSDTTIAEYQQRVNRDDGILVMIPFEGIWTTMLKRLARLEEETDFMRQETAALRQQVCKPQFLQTMRSLIVYPDEKGVQETTTNVSNKLSP
jgi:hypothetical protein